MLCETKNSSDVQTKAYDLFVEMLDVLRSIPSASSDVVVRIASSSDFEHTNAVLKTLSKLSQRDVTLRRDPLLSTAFAVESTAPRENPKARKRLEKIERTLNDVEFLRRAKPEAIIKLREQREKTARKLGRPT